MIGFWIDPLRKKTVIDDISIDGDTYYLNQTGDDVVGDGTIGNPWRSLVKAQSVLKDGDTVILGPGIYGIFKDKAERSKWVNYISHDDARLLGISLRDTTNVLSLKTRFWGIKIIPASVDPSSTGLPGSDDPQYAESTTNTYTKTPIPVDLLRMTDVEFYNCEVTNRQSKYLTPYGIHLELCKNIRVEGCEVHEITSAIRLINTTDTFFYYNNVHSICQTHFGNSAGCKNIVIEGNHGWDRNWNKLEDYCPRTTDPFHGSFISIYSSNFIIRNNIFHDGGGSSGIMLYNDPDPAIRSNILIENNLVYDMHSLQNLRLYDTGENIVIRNNIFIGKNRSDTITGARKYYTAFELHSCCAGYSAADIELYNNIFVGEAIFHNGDSKLIKQANNIFWSISDDYVFYKQDQMWNDSKVITWDNTFPTYFSEGFFNGELDVSWQEDWDIATLGLNQPGHGKILDLTYTEDCEAINFGNINTCPVYSLGSLNENGFINIDGNIRSVNHSSVGCYEMADPIKITVEKDKIITALSQMLYSLGLT